jgi:thioredoxin 1
VGIAHQISTNLVNHFNWQEGEFYLIKESIVSSVIEITDGEFDQEVLQADKPVLAYFWASWCGPCRLTSPTINWVADNYGDRLKVVKLEVDPNPNSVAQYKVEGVPALRLFKDRELILSHEGAIGKQQLQAMLEEKLN